MRIMAALHWTVTRVALPGEIQPSPGFDWYGMHIITESVRPHRIASILMNRWKWKVQNFPGGQQWLEMEFGVICDIHRWKSLLRPGHNTSSAFALYSTTEGHRLLPWSRGTPRTTLTSRPTTRTRGKTSRDKKGFAKLGSCWPFASEERVDYAKN